jgi:DNA-binding NarL/FixJ family response regulator
MIQRMSEADPGAARPIRVLIADDHPVVRQGTRVLLLEERDVEVVGEAADGREAVERAVELAPDVVLMDLRMPEMDGVEAIRELAGRAPSVRVLLLTGSGVDERTFDALEAGALGYLSKSAGRAELLAALRRVARDEPSLPPELTRQLLARLGSPAPGEHHALADPLTEREEEVLVLVAEGLSNRGIADRLHVSETTVRTHVSRILAKLGVSNRVQAALWALRSGLARLDDTAG